MNDLYKEKYDVDKVDYKRSIGNDGTEVETILFYKADKHIIENPPDISKEIDKILKILKGTGIGKITITFMDKNL